ncbi:hypothetical protein BJ741DRAFT_618153 [Chytriomyces cf. hyalinus JEL632]|nr:hypothetical protein BJ741DRAFT_618153 [Chytriomyces cf. hyalinus JEL632]
MGVISASQGVQTEAAIDIWAVSIQADSEIEHVSQDAFTEWVKTGTKFLFLGATYCPYTAEFNPMWLQVQKEVKKQGWDKIPDFGIRKVECAGIENFCTNQFADGYPTINLYQNGVYIKEIVENEDVLPAVSSHAKLLLLSMQSPDSIEKSKVFLSDPNAAAVVAPTISPAFDSTTYHTQPSTSTAAIASAASVISDTTSTPAPEYVKLLHHVTGANSASDFQGLLPVLIVSTSLAFVILAVFCCRKQRQKKYLPISGSAKGHVVHYV